MKMRLIAPDAHTFPTIQNPDGSTVHLNPGEVADFPSDMVSSVLEPVIAVKAPKGLNANG